MKHLKYFSACTVLAALFGAVSAQTPALHEDDVSAAQISETKDILELDGISTIGSTTPVIGIDEISTINEEKNTDVLSIINSLRMAYPITEPQWLDIPTYDGTGLCVHPSVCVPQSGSGLFGGHKYWMAMTPFANSNDLLENPSILCSDDGINWSVPDGVTNPIVPPIAQPQSGATWYNADPNLVFNPFDGYMYLYYNITGSDIETVDGIKYNCGTRMIRSKNGVKWSEPEQIRLKFYNGKEGPITFSGSGIECLAPGVWVALGNRNKGGNAYSIKQANMRLFISNDGITWRELPATYDNLAGSHWHISFRRFASGFHFISSVANNESGSAYNLNLFYGYSPDGKAPLFDSTPLFGVDGVNIASKKWYASCIVPLGQKTARVYFSGLNRVESGQAADDTWRIGYFDVAINNPYFFYVNSPQYKMGYTPVWLGFELRDTDTHLPFLLNTDETSFFGLKKLCEFKECSLICINTLKDENNAGIDVTIEVLTRYNDSNLVAVIDGQTQKAKIPSVNQTTVLTKDSLKALGIRSIDRVGFRISASTAPKTGYISVFLVPQE